MSNQTALLPEAERRLHRALLEGLLTTGDLPKKETLAEAIGIDQSELPSLLTELEAADYLALDDDGWPTCLYPLSPTPTPHVVEFDGKRRYAMCSIDALGMAAMLDRTLNIMSACAVCQEPIHIVALPGAITQVEPQETVAVAGRDHDRPACESCCPSTLFACSPEHGQALAARLPRTSVISLDEALASGEKIFGGMLAEQLPAHRPRMHMMESSGQT